jgi:hypothetical protein
MTSGGQPIDRLRDFLRELKPEARNLLISEIERGLLRGDEIPGAELILQELRRSMRDAGESPSRVDHSARLFFKPLEPFLVDDAPDHKHKGRIARTSLDPIWNWVCRDLLPEKSEQHRADVNRALGEGDTVTADKLTRSFQDDAVAKIDAMLGAAQQDQKALRKMAMQVGTPRALEDVTSLHGVLKARDALVALGARLPTHFKNLVDDQLVNVKSLLDVHATRSPDMFVYSLLLVMSRMAASWQLVRLATLAAVSDDASRVAESSYAVTVTIVLAEIERMVSELKADLKSGRGVAVTALLKSIHDATRGLRTELDMPVDSPWGKQLAAIRTEISHRLKAEIESMPGRVRRLLRPRPASDIAAGAVLDAGDVADTEALIELVGVSRTYAGELAISEMTMRCYNELEQYLDTGIETLLEGLRNAGAGDRPFRQSQVDAAVRFCAKVFGQEYASLLTKAAEVAGQHKRKAAARA